MPGLLRQSRFDVQPTQVRNGSGDAGSVWQRAFKGSRHCVVSRHPTQVLVVTSQISPPAQPVSSMHSTHRDEDVSQVGVVPEQSALARHWTQTWVVSLQTGAATLH